MGWFKKKTNDLKGGNGVALANRAQAVSVYPYEMTYGQAMDMKTRDYLDVYGSGDYANVWVYACIRAISQAVANVPFKFYFDFKDERRPLPASHPLTRLFWGPNPHTTRFELWEAVMVYLELTGNCFLALEEASGENGQPTEIWPLDPSKVRILKHKEKKVAGYVFQAGQDKVAYDPDEMLHLKYFNPTDDYWGLSPLSASRLGIVADYNAVKWNANFFRQGARPSGVITVDTDLGDDEFSRFKAEIERGYSGADRAHKVLLLAKGMSYQSAQIPQKDMEFVEQRKLSREEILGVYKVPPVEVGIFEYANYANSEIQDKIFWTKCVIPRLKRIEEMVNTFLVPRFGNLIFGEFDLSRVEALRENEDLKMTIARKAVGSGLESQIWTVNEARKRLWNMLPIEEVGESETQALSCMPQTLEFRVEDFLEDSLVDNGWLLDKAKVFHLDTLRTWANKELKNIGESIDFQVSDPRVVDYLKKQGASLVKNVNTTTREALRKSLLKAVQGGETIPQIAERIQAIFAKATESRAFTIARTETVGASNFGALEAYRQAGVEGKGWITARDEKVRPSHVRAGEDYVEGIAIEAFFIINGYQMERPGDSSHGAPVGEVASCRCKVSPRARLSEKQNLALEDAQWNEFVLYLTPRERKFEGTVIGFFERQEARLMKKLGTAGEPAGVK